MFCSGSQYFAKVLLTDMHLRGSLFSNLLPLALPRYLRSSSLNAGVMMQTSVAWWCDSAHGCMQVNARMGGGPVYAMNQFVWGVDLVEEQFLGCCGIPSRPYLSKTPQKCIAEFSINAQKTGTLQNVDWVDVSHCALPTCIHT